MADLEMMMKFVDELSQNDLDVLYRHIIARRQASWWIVTPENITKIEEVLRPLHEQTSQMTEEEINQTLDQAITEVRHERKANRRV